MLSRVLGASFDFPTLKFLHATAKAAQFLDGSVYSFCTWQASCGGMLTDTPQTGSMMSTDLTHRGDPGTAPLMDAGDLSTARTMHT